MHFQLLPPSDNEEKVPNTANLLLLESFDIESLNPNAEGGKSRDKVLLKYLNRKRGGLG
jgi:hypothetical protein